MRKNPDPYLICNNGTKIPLTEDQYKRLLKRRRINPYDTYYLDPQGILVVMGQISSIHPSNAKKKEDTVEL